MAFYEHSCERESPSPSLLSLTFYSPYSALCVCHLFRLFVRLQSLTRMFTHSLPVSIPSFHSFIHSSSRLHVCRCSISFCWPVFPPSRLFQNAPNSGATRPIAPTYPDSNRQILKFPEKNWFLAKFPFLLWFRNFHWWSHRVFLWWRNVIRSLLKCCMSHAEWREISPHFESLNHFNHSNHPLFGSWNSAKPPFPPIQYPFPASFSALFALLPFRTPGAFVLLFHLEKNFSIYGSPLVDFSIIRTKTRENSGFPPIEFRKMNRRVFVFEFSGIAIFSRNFWEIIDLFADR